MEKMIYTHSETFHPDEIMAIALLSKFWFKKNVDNLSIVRTRNKEVLDKMLETSHFVIDVGRKYSSEKFNFDHHQKDLTETWSDGCPLSSCGMIYLFLKNEGLLKPLSESVVLELETLVKQIDLTDNGLSEWKYSSIFSNFNRDPKDEKNQYEHFRKALVFAEQFLENYLYESTKKVGIKKEVERALNNSITEEHEEVVIVETSPDFLMNSELINTKAIWTAHEHKEGYWYIQNIPKSAGNMFVGKRNMPALWCGLENDTSLKVTGFNVLFCHKGGFFMSISGTKEEMLKIVKAMLQLKPLGE